MTAAKFQHPVCLNLWTYQNLLIKTKFNFSSVAQHKTLFLSCFYSFGLQISQCQSERIMLFIQCGFEHAVFIQICGTVSSPWHQPFFLIFSCWHFRKPVDSWNTTGCGHGQKWLMLFHTLSFLGIRNEILFFF